MVTQNNFKEQNKRKAREWLDTLRHGHFKDLYPKNLSNVFVFTTTGNNYDYISSLQTQQRNYNTTKVSLYTNTAQICARAAITHATEPIQSCILVFGSYTQPGGGFLEGAVAQEEDLCHTTNLYPYLEKLNQYYSSHRTEQALNNSLYRDDCIYIKGGNLVINNKVYTTDFLNIAAPNAKAAKCKRPYDGKLVHVPSKILQRVLEERMEIAYLTPALHGATHYIIGAFGCGVFGNDVRTVAENWKELQLKYDGLYKELIIAVPEPDKMKVFKEVFK